jgi:hypothetical protein
MLAFAAPHISLQQIEESVECNGFIGLEEGRLSEKQKIKG